MSDFFEIVRSFLNSYLPAQKCLSENSICSYRQALNLFVKFLRDEKSYPITKIQFSILNRELILEFLDWIENVRKCSVITRNHRLMVLRSFFDYAGMINCTHTALYLDTLNIPTKESKSKTVEYLSETALSALLNQPDPTKRNGLRNLTFMVLMYDTGARCCELLNMRIKDLRINITNPIAYLHGKGRKTRIVPLLPKTVQHCSRYLKKFHPNESSDSEKPVFYTTIHGVQGNMSHDTVSAFIKSYGTMASQICHEIPRHVHPHMLRHSRAMHLYHEGMPLELISQFLGHTSVETTKIYAYADTEMKRAAIEKIDALNISSQPIAEIWDNDEDMILKLSGLM